jgi:hypothetical protein
MIPNLSHLTLRGAIRQRLVNPLGMRACQLLTGIDGGSGCAPHVRQKRAWCLQRAVAGPFKM